MYICMYVNIHVHMYILQYVYIHMNEKCGIWMKLMRIQQLFLRYEYIYIHLYIYVFIFIYICVHLVIFFFECMYVNVHIYYIHRNLYIHMSEKHCIWMKLIANPTAFCRSWINIHIYIYKYIYIYIYAYIFIYREITI